MSSNWNDLQITWITWFSGSGIVLNLTLLYLISTDKNKNGDGYRKILMIISCYNIFYALVHYVVDMGSEQTFRDYRPCFQGILVDETGYIAFSYRLSCFGFWYSYLGIQVFISSFIMSLSLLAIHCLYRYVKITGCVGSNYSKNNQAQINLTLLRFTFMFDRWYCVLLLIICHFLFAFLVVLFSSLTITPSLERDQISGVELMQRYNLSIVNLGYIGPSTGRNPLLTGSWDYQWKDIAGALACHSLQTITYTAICICAIKLYFFLHRTLLSPKAKAMNMQLMRLLLVEATSPLLFEYVPAFAAMWGGFLGLPMSEAAFYVPILFSCYSGAEALLTILGFTAYRRRIFGFNKQSFRIQSSNERNTRDEMK